MSYISDYSMEIHTGLNNMIITDGQGQAIDFDAANKTFSDKVEEIKAKEGFIFFCGNGASCSMAEHMSCDFFQSAVVNTQTCSNTSQITAVSNDISYEDVFAYRIQRVMSENDMLFTISSSGNSPNIIKAIKTAETNGSFIVTLSGKGEDNKSRQMGDLNFYIPLTTYGLVESAHAVLVHILLDHHLDTFMGGRH